MSTQVIGQRIALDCVWKGPSWLGERGKNIHKIKLDFKGIAKKFCVEINAIIEDTKPRPLKFSCKSYHDAGLDDRQTVKRHPASLSVCIEKIQNLKLQAIFMEGRKKTTIPVELALPENFETGKTYTLLIISMGVGLTAIIERADCEEKRKKRVDAFSGESSQSHHYAPKLPPTHQDRPSASPASPKTVLSELSIGELQSLFAIANRRDLELEACRNAESARLDRANTLFLFDVAEALENKNIKACPPTSYSLEGTEARLLELYNTSIEILKQSV